MRAFVFLSVLCALAGDAPPIPQDRELQDRQHRETLAWYRARLEEQYEKVGQKDPKWDAAARNAFSLAARNLADAGEPPPDASEVATAMMAALDAGCTDPAVRYFRVTRQAREEFPSADEYLSRTKAAVLDLEKSPYPASIRATALLHYARLASEERALPPAEKVQAERMVNAALALMPSIVTEGTTRDDQLLWFDLHQMAITAFAGLGDDDRLAAFRRVDIELAKTPGLKVTRLLVKGARQVRDGWDVLEKARENNSREESDKSIELLKEAGTTLEAAWAAQPNNELTANYMLWVQYGAGKNREDMETWFARAMQANPGNREACETKLACLDPRWRGSTESMMEFATQCRETKNWKAGIPLIAAEAHVLQYRFLESQGDLHPSYLKQEKVWEDVRTVYTEHLNRNSRDHHARTRYACICVLAERFAEADRQFKILGNRVTKQNDFDAEWIRRAQQAAADRAGEKNNSP